MLVYTTRGEGPRTVLLLHGFLGAGRNLASLARAWSEVDAGLRLVLPDLAGHGRSPPLPPGADLHALAADVVALAERVAPGSAVALVGHSLGGRVALRARALDPERFPRVVLLDSAPARADAGEREVRAVVHALLAAPVAAPSRGAMEAELRAQGLGAATVAWLSMNLDGDAAGVRWRIDRRALGALLERTQAEDLWSVVEAQGGELELVRGGRSGYVAEGDAARFLRAGRRVVTIPDAGHYVHVDAPAAVLAALRTGAAGR